MNIESEMDASTEHGKRMAATRLADDLERLCCAETESEFFKYLTDRAGSIVALLRVYARSPYGSREEVDAARLYQTLMGLTSLVLSRFPSAARLWKQGGVPVVQDAIDAIETFKCYDEDSAQLHDRAAGVGK